MKTLCLTIATVLRSGELRAQESRIALRDSGARLRYRQTTETVGRTGHLLGADADWLRLRLDRTEEVVHVPSATMARCAPSGAAR